MPSGATGAQGGRPRPCGVPPWSPSGHRRGSGPASSSWCRWEPVVFPW